MGQFTVSDTLNLLLVGTLLGVVGAGIYALLRGLRIGPRWFQVLTIGAGPAVVVGAMIVHTNGVDFRLLEPTWLAIGLFVAIPGIYAALLTLLAERVLHPGGWWERAPFPLAQKRRSLRSSRRSSRRPVRRATPWATVIFAPPG
jgi:hypothetical protein